METEKRKAPCRVKITGSSKPQSWYRNKIGEVFETDNAPDSKNFIVWEDFIDDKVMTWRHIQQCDCERV